MTTYLLISVFAFVWANILIQPGEIFSFVKPTLAKAFGQEGELDVTKLHGLQYGIAKVLICQDCLSGEIALWYSVFHPVFEEGRTALWYIGMISVSIAGAHFLAMVNNYLKASIEACKA